MAAWYEYGIATANAVALGAKYGLGPVRSGAEVADFAAAMRTDGAQPLDVCLLSAWLGGAAEDSARTSVASVLVSLATLQLGKANAQIDANRKAGKSAAVACGVAGADADAVAKAWLRLHALSPMLATVVNIKASAKAAQSGVQLAASAPSSARQWWAEVKNASQGGLNAGKDATAAVVQEASKVAAKVAKEGAEAAAAAIRAALAFQAELAKNLLNPIVGAIPWYVWAGLGVVAIGSLAYVTAPYWLPRVAVPS